MLNFGIFCFVIVVVVLTGAEESKYTTRYDNINLDAIINNERLLKQYHECLMDRGRCTKEGQELRSEF